MERVDRHHHRPAINPDPPANAEDFFALKSHIKELP
jgi:hypothetical protein